MENEQETAKEIESEEVSEYEQEPTQNSNKSHPINVKS